MREIIEEIYNQELDKLIGERDIVKLIESRSLTKNAQEKYV